MDGLNQAETFIDVGALEDIPPLGARTVATASGDIAIFRTNNDEVFALRDQCPHKKGPLSQGIVHGTTVTCPLHNWVISLQSGEAQGLDTGCTPRFNTKVEAGRVFLALA
ncbi:MAG: nitrite reductase small subunit NirD [Rhodospirillales bacterium]|nr:nitrite reductase small subunit NirD [Rhodospirillales bacterium]